MRYCQICHKGIRGLALCERECTGLLLKSQLGRSKLQQNYDDFSFLGKYVLDKYICDLYMSRNSKIKQ